ncbi:MAG TPA: SRPBCC domain-containing protein, partial [Gammaproteobacteria bacterium]
MNLFDSFIAGSLKARQHVCPQLEINNAFNVPVPIADAWVVLTDIEEIVPCMPGAELVEVIDESTYRG